MRSSLIVCLVGCSIVGCGAPAAPTHDATPTPSVQTVAHTAAIPADTAALPTFTLDYLRGRFDPATHPDFTKVDPAVTDGDGTYYLRKDAYAAFMAMYAAAKADGVVLKIISATRNFDRQKRIWEAKWTGERLLEGREKAPTAYPDPQARALAILRWSSMPGTSRHHWGTDMDFNNLTNEYFASGEGLKIYTWLTTHAPAFGFCQPYSPKGTERPYGYNEEKWHWSYLPVALQLIDQARLQLSDAQIDGFKGAETAAAIGVVGKYVLGVSSDCKE